MERKETVMEKRDEILLVVQRLVSIGAGDSSIADVMCNACEYLLEYADSLSEPQQQAK